MTAQDELWIPLVDEPIGGVVAELAETDPEIARLVAGPRRTLAFKTFAYLKVGLLLGELLVESDVTPEDGTSWVEQLLREPATHERVRGLLREIAEQIAADTSYGDDDLPDDEARERFRAFARNLRASD
jgi:hypothetical protein